MNRQETIIRIAKINRFVKQLNYWCELGMEINLEVFGDGLYEIDRWVAEVHEYLRENPVTILVGMVEDVGSTITIKEYMNTTGKRLPAKLRRILLNYIENMDALLKDCSKLHKISKGKYSNLPDKLANGKAADLLKRAVKAGYLDKEYQPLDSTTPLQMKAMSYAISQIMCFGKHHVYTEFNRLWQRGGYTLSTVTVPRLTTEGYQEIIDLYPEADFSEFVRIYEGSVFNSPFDEQRRIMLYRRLKYEGYIDQATTQAQFLGIFDKEKFTKPVNWIREQRQLAYFAKCAFDSTNSKNLWVKTYCCFLVNGEKPHKESFVTGYSQLVRSVDIDNYHPNLKAIAEEYCGISTSKEKVAEEATDI